MADGGVLEKYLTDVQTDGGNVKWSKNPRGEVQVLWLQTRALFLATENRDNVLSGLRMFKSSLLVLFYMRS